MLKLTSTTDPLWIGRALANMDDILLDHAHCEKKAASTALSLIFRYPDRPALKFVRQKPSPYAGKLMSIVRPLEPARLLDTLLCCALIEARSCERMKLLSEHLEDPELSDLYRGLLAVEARHNTTYLELAREYFSQGELTERFHVVATHEASILREAPDVPRLHN